jgi:PAS domain S-box-containing protein
MCYFLDRPVTSGSNDSIDNATTLVEYWMEQDNRIMASYCFLLSRHNIGDNMLPNDVSPACSIYKELFDTTSDLVLIADNQGFITEINDKAKQLFPDGLKKNELFWIKLELDCSNLQEVLDWFSNPETTTGSAPKNYICKFTGKIYDINLVTLRNIDKSIKRFLVVLKDITCLITRHAELERRVNERTVELSHSKKMLQSVFQAVGKGIFLVDEDMEIIKSNQKAAEIFGIHSENLLGVSISSLFDPSDEAKISTSINTIIENQILSSELTAIYFDKSNFPAFFTLTVTCLENKRIWIVIVEDLTEQKSIENQLKFEKNHSEESNITLRNVLLNIQQEQRDVADKLSHKIATDILPALDKIKSAPSIEVRNGYIDFLGELLVSLTKGSESELNAGLLRLSKNELKICKFIQSGFSSKEICATMNLAFDTIQTHRKNIRKKLGLAGSGNVSLHGHLLTMKLP